jgi:hypothetical protein
LRVSSRSLPKPQLRKTNAGECIAVLEQGEIIVIDHDQISCFRLSRDPLIK